MGTNNNLCKHYAAGDHAPFNNFSWSRPEKNSAKFIAQFEFKYPVIASLRTYLCTHLHVNNLETNLEIRDGIPGLL